MTPVLQLAMLVCCAVILWRADRAIDAMSTGSRLIVRVAYWALAVGAIAQIGTIVLYGDRPSLPALIVAAGIAGLLAGERRIRSLVAPRQGGRHTRVI
ncbi:hypothetical protein [Denitromonas sp.]|uniref:hypothetical protein n=1 Tax=Denitromonas sp. TaxID=2734609 RepID=UPI003A87F7D6